MRLYQHEATRIHGALQIELADGGMAILELDLDISSPTSSMGIETEYVQPEGFDMFVFRRVEAQKFWVRIPGENIGLLDDGVMFRLRAPTS